MCKDCANEIQSFFALVLYNYRFGRSIDFFANWKTLKKGIDAQAGLTFFG